MTETQEQQTESVAESVVASDAESEDTSQSAVAVKHPVLRALVFAAGILLILIGFLLGFVPFLPGFPLGLAGIALLAATSARVRRQLRKLLRLLPKKLRDKIEPHLRPKR